MSDKTEHASPYKLQKAKEKGQVAKSQELLTSTLLLTAVLVLALKSNNPFVLYLQQYIIQAPHIVWTKANLLSIMHHLFINGLYWALPIVIIPFLALIIAALIQNKGVWAPTVIKPDWSRVNPISGLKRMFSVKTLFDALKNTLKLSGAALLIGLMIMHNQNTFIALSLDNHNRFAFYHLLLNTTLSLVLYGLGLAIIDVLYTKHQFLKNQKMTKHEVKEEYKQREGNPTIKAKIKQLRWQLRQKTKALSQIKHADILITNPTHFAIALKYTQHAMPAPKVICKGQGTYALLMKQLAKRHAIQIVENKVLARALYANTELNAYIDKAWYPMVADIFRTHYRHLLGHA